MADRIEFEQIVPWNGANDTGRDVRLKWKRNFDKIAAAITELYQGVGVDKFLRKDQPDETAFLIRFLAGIAIGAPALGFGITDQGLATLERIIANGIQSRNFDTGLLGGQGFGIWTDQNGKTHIESDYLTTRIKAVFAELEIRKLTYSGGNFIFSSAGSRIYRVVPIDSAYRCYFVADDGTTQTENWWKVGDQARCQTFNIKSAGVYQNTGNRYYWRLVTNVGEEMLEDGKMYNYADLSDIDGLVILEDEHGDQYRCIGKEEGVDNDIPAAEDTIVQQGSQIDTTRQGMYQIVVYGDEAPGTFMYSGINDYNLSNHIVMKNSPRGMKVLASNFEVVSNADANVTAPIVCYRGDWTSGMVCGHYDSVDYQGSEWLCIVPMGETTTDAPSSSSPNWRVRVSSGASITVTASFVVYQVGNSGTTAPTGTWSNTVPAAQQGKFLWSKHVVNYSDGTHTEVFSVSRYGTDGTSVSITSTAVNYGKSNAADVLPSSWVGDVTQLHILPGEYLWTRTVVNYSDGQSTTAYGISRIGSDGTNGDPGAAGQNGQTTYVHIAYATDTQGTNFSTTLDRTNFYKCWGTYTDYTRADSTDWHDYNWSYFKGEKGDTGDTGPKGDNGADGISALSKGVWTSSLVESNGGTLPQSSIVSMGDGSYISKVATALPPFFTYLSPAGKRYILAGGGYLLNGKVNGEWNLVARHGTDGIDGVPGPTGPQGPKGEPGTGVAILGNYDTLAELQAAHPTGSAGDAYMVDKNLYVWNVQYNQWRDAGQIKGNDGVSSYFHVKYSNDGGTTFTPDDGEQVGAYIGTYVDFHEDDSMNPGDYKWKLMQGAQGADGRNGIDGQNGADGRTSYLHIKYSDDGQTFTSNDGEDPGDWLGQYVDFTQADSMVFSTYKWSHIKGQQGLRGLQGPQGDRGVQGPAGQDGRTTYFHIKYSSVANPTQTSQIHETPDVYIGTYVDFNQADSASPSAYTWSRFQGLQGANGEQGIPGTNGADGTTYYLHIAYANSADGTEGFDVSDSVNKLYIGQYTDTTQADSTNPSRYSWTKVKGEKGDPGEDGVSAEFIGNWSTTLVTQKGGSLSEGNIVRMGGGSYGVKTATANPPCWTYLSPAGNRYRLAGGGYLLNGILNTAEWMEVANDGANGKDGRDGADGKDGAFKSIVFLRSNTQPAAPTGGSYETPIPAGWSDGIPAGTEIIWASVCTFSADGTSSGWSTPAPQSDTDTLDIEFSPNVEKPANPAGDDPKADNRTARLAQGWYDPSASGFDGTAMKWRAERKISNGVYDGAWTITQIVGEKGEGFDALGRWSSALVEEHNGSLPKMSVVLMGRDSFSAKNDTALPPYFTYLNPAGKRYILAGGGYLLNGVVNTADWSEIAFGGLNGADGANGRDGADGTDGAFKSMVFLRSNTQPATPNGGTYEYPIPAGWSDGIPNGVEIIWASVCTFHADGSSSGWSIPAPQSDSDTLDIEFSPNATKPANPAGNDPKADNRAARQAQGWYDPSSQGFDGTNMKWRAERKISNGQYNGAWTITQILGEKGDKGDKGDAGENGQNGQNGQNGIDGIDLVLSPAVIIIPQSTVKDGQGNYPLILEGAWTAPMCAKGTTHQAVQFNSVSEGDAQSRCTWQIVQWIDTEGGFNGGQMTFKLWIKTIKTHQVTIDGTTVNQYWDNGTLNINVTAGGITKTLPLRWAVNLLGSAITISVGDMTRTLRQKGVFDTNDNFTALSYTLFKSQYEISAQGLSSVFETMKDDIEDNSSAITQQADAISLRVTKAALKQTAGIDIDANTVRLTGQITANGNVRIETDGSITAKNGAFDGLLKNEFKFLSATRISHLEVEGYWYVITRFTDKLRYSNVYLNPITQPHITSYLDLPKDAYGAQFLIYNKDEYPVGLMNYGTEPLIGDNVILSKKAKRCTCVGNTTEGFKGYIFEDIV